MRLIDADALMQTLGITDTDCDKCAWYNKEYMQCKRGDDFEDVCCAIEDAPTIDAIPARIIPPEIYECSKCGKNVMTDDIEAYAFCHGCGAMMGGLEDV